MREERVPAHVSVREYYLTRALDSARSCYAVMKDMTLAEIDRAIELEEGSLRRKSVLTLLYRQSRVLASREHAAKLKEKIHGT